MIAGMGITKDYITTTKVYRIVDGGTPQLIKTSEDPAFTSYLDTDAPEGEVEYTVARYVEPRVYQPSFGFYYLAAGDYQETQANVQQGTITGTVQNSNGEALADYDITLMSTPKTVTTDANGKFTFENVSFDDHQLIVTDDLGTELARYNLHFSPGTATSYSIDGNDVSLVVTANTIAIDILIETSDDGRSAEIIEITFIENPQTGHNNAYWLIGIAVMLGLLAMGAFYKTRRA